MDEMNSGTRCHLVAEKMRYIMKNLDVKSRLALAGTTSLLLLSVSGAAHAELVVGKDYSVSRSTTTVDHSSLSVALAAKQTYGSQSGYKWVNQGSDVQSTASTWVANDQSSSGFKWSVSERHAAIADENLSQALINSNDQSGEAHQAGYRWGIRNVSDQAGYRWGIRNVADQAGYRWGIRNVADQAGYRWGIRNVADQAGYRWGIRNVADQAGYRWGIRNVADQAGYRWGIR